MAYDCPWLSEFFFNYRPSLNTQTHKAFVNLNFLSLTHNPPTCTLSLSFTEHKQPCLTHSHNEFQPHESPLKRGPWRAVGIWAVFLSHSPRGLWEEWILYGEKIMGKKVLFTDGLVSTFFSLQQNYLLGQSLP